MKLQESNLNCQIPCLQLLAEGKAVTPPQSMIRRAKIFIRCHLTPTRERAFKNFTNGLMNRFDLSIGKSEKPKVDLNTVTSKPLKSGDWVRVRSLDEIQATLNHWHQLKGCSFMPEMAAYCGTQQRVLKPLRRFVDERDLQVKKSSGILLLKGVMCQGTADFGSCDRCCYTFWRQEWLEKIDPPDQGG